MRRDGSRIPVELTVTRSDVEGEPLFIGFLRDLSGLRADPGRARGRRGALPPARRAGAGRHLHLRLRRGRLDPLHQPADRGAHGLPAGALDRGPPVLGLASCTPTTAAGSSSELARRTRAGDPGRLRVPLRRRRRLGRARARPGDDRRATPTAGRCSPRACSSTSRSCAARRRACASRRRRSPRSSSRRRWCCSRSTRTASSLLSEGKALELLGLEPGEVVGPLGVRGLRGRAAGQGRRRAARSPGSTVSVLMEVGDLVFDVSYSPVRGPLTPAARP